jgi:hypothetical protein
VPDGVAGELFVGGAGVARGYLNRPELTTARFLPNPYGPGTLYRSGDRARFQRGEGLLFEGRLDDQVKIRGFRIEPGEVQSALAAHPAVADCAVLAHTAGGGDARLAAYVVAAPGTPTPAELREFLRGKLPEYMVPASFTFLDALPLTANGKLDRRSLPAPVEEREQSVVGPSSDAERAIAEIWQELLGLEKIGVHENFFELGGHSLLAAQLAARVRSRFETALSVRAVFEQPTVAGLAALLEAPSTNGRAASIAIPPRPADEAWPLGFSQQQLWLLDQWDPGAPTYNVALAYRVRGALDLEALRRATEQVLARHEALRTVIEVRAEQPVPILLGDPQVELELLERPSCEDDVAAELARLAARPFDFARDPLLRLSAIRVGPDDHVVLLETHHIAFDGWSEKVLLEELASLYAGGQPEPLARQFGDFARWQRQWMASEEFHGELRWWRSHLAGAPTTIPLPADHSRPEGRRFRGASLDVRLGEDVALAVRELCREENVTPYMFVLAALATLLYRITGQDDVLIGSPVANRLAVELEPLIGFFSNTLVFRARMAGNPSFRQLLGRVREMALGVYAHQGVPFEKIVEAIGPEREPGVNPLFQVNLRVSTARRPVPALPGVSVEPVKIHGDYARFDLALDLDVLEHELAGYLRYNRDLFEPATIAALAGELVAVLTAAALEPDRDLLSFELRGAWGRRAGVARPGAGSLSSFRGRAREPNS